MNDHESWDVGHGTTAHNKKDGCPHRVWFILMSIYSCYVLKHTHLRESIEKLAVLIVTHISYNAKIKKPMLSSYSCPTWALAFPAQWSWAACCAFADARRSPPAAPSWLSAAAASFFLERGRHLPCHTAGTWGASPPAAGYYSPLCRPNEGRVPSRLDMTWSL